MQSFYILHFQGYRRNKSSSRHGGRNLEMRRRRDYSMLARFSGLIR